MPKKSHKTPCHWHKSGASVCVSLQGVYDIGLICRHWLLFSEQRGQCVCVCVCKWSGWKSGTKAAVGQNMTAVCCCWSEGRGSIKEAWLTAREKVTSTLSRLINILMSFLQPLPLCTLEMRVWYHSIWISREKCKRPLDPSPLSALSLSLSLSLSLTLSFRHHLRVPNSKAVQNVRSLIMDPMEAYFQNFFSTQFRLRYLVLHILHKNGKKHSRNSKLRSDWLVSWLRVYISLEPVTNT